MTRHVEPATVFWAIMHLSTFSGYSMSFEVTNSVVHTRAGDIRSIMVEQHFIPLLLDTLFKGKELLAIRIACSETLYSLSAYSRYSNKCSYLLLNFPRRIPRTDSTIGHCLKISQVGSSRSIPSRGRQGPSSMRSGSRR